jgi:hypothetical protein
MRIGRHAWLITWAVLLVAACGDDDEGETVAAGAFGATCAGNQDCEMGLICYAFGMGSKCTVECPADPANCPGPTKECNNMTPAVCKV